MSNKQTQKSWLIAVTVLLALVANQAAAQDGERRAAFEQPLNTGSGSTGFTGTVGTFASAGQRTAQLESFARAGTGFFAEGRLFGFRKVISDVGVQSEALRTGRTLSGGRSCARASFRVVGIDMMPPRGRCDAFGSTFDLPLEERSRTQVFLDETGSVTFAGIVTASFRLKIVGGVGLRWRARVENASRNLGFAITEVNTFSNLAATGSVGATVIGFGFRITGHMEIVQAEIVPSHTATRAFDMNIDPNPAINTYYAARMTMPLKLKGLDGKVDVSAVTPVGAVYTKTIWNPAPAIDIAETMEQFFHAVAPSPFVR